MPRTDTTDGHCLNPTAGVTLVNLFSPSDVVESPPIRVESTPIVHANEQMIAGCGRFVVVFPERVPQGSQNLHRRSDRILFGRRRMDVLIELCQELDAPSGFARPL